MVMPSLPDLGGATAAAGTVVLTATGASLGFTATDLVCNVTPLPVTWAARLLMYL